MEVFHDSLNFDVFLVLKLLKKFASKVPKFIPMNVKFLTLFIRLIINIYKLININKKNRDLEEIVHKL